jgi:hypothetical protein
LIIAYCEDEQVTLAALEYLDSECHGLNATVFIDKGDEALAHGNSKIVEIEYSNLLELAHELVHAKQFIKGELSSRILAEGSKISYRKRPWEVEAFAKETEIYNTYFLPIVRMRRQHQAPEYGPINRTQEELMLHV